LSGDKRINRENEKMKLVRVKTVRLVQVGKRYVKYRNEENVIQNMTFGFTNIHVDGGERPHYLLCMNILTADSKRPNKRHQERLSAKCVEKNTGIFHR
jgi:hypothetical protein